MLNIRPVSDLRNKFPEIENLVLNENRPVFLTKNGHGSMVLLSLEHFSELTDEIEAKLDEADVFAKSTSERYSANEVFSRVRKRIAKK